MINAIFIAQINIIEADIILIQTAVHLVWIEGLNFIN